MGFMRVLVVVVVAVLGLVPSSAHAECNGDPNQKACGQFCIANDRTCCDTIGRDDLSCAAGTHCVAPDKCAEDCVEDQVQCGNACIDPNERVCCDEVGHPGVTCSVGHTCTSEGQCDSIADQNCSSSGDGGNPLLALGVLISLGVITLRRRSAA
jgi:uncharacterized protein (TIGR03382 family)